MYLCMYEIYPKFSSFSYAHMHTYVFRYACPLSLQTRKTNLGELKKLKQLPCQGRHFYKLFS